MEFDVVIIGAGPAGTSAGIELNRKGIKNCIIDKNIFPRNKTCGGLLTEKTFLLLDEMNIKVPNEIIKNKTNKVKILDKGEEIIDINCKSDFYLVDRSDFDNYLLEIYEREKGVFFGGKRVIKIDIKNKAVELEGGDFIKYKILIGADGATGVTQKYVNRKKISYAFGIEVEIPNKDLSINNEEIILDVGLFSDGYAWCFPKGKYSTIGYAFSYDKNFDYLKFMKNYLKEMYNYNDDINFKGAFLPYGVGSENVINEKSNIMLIGDAAGFIDAVTGEGTYYAILSGKKVAELIAFDFENCIKLYLDYARKINNLVRKSWKYTSLFYKYREKILSHLRKKEISRSAITFIEHQVAFDDYNYNIFKIITSYLKNKIRR